MSPKSIQKERAKKAKQKPGPYKLPPYPPPSQALRSLYQQGDCLLIHEDGTLFYIPKFAVH